MLVGATSPAQTNKLLGYLDDGAVFNGGLRLDTPFWQKVSIKSIDFLFAMADNSITAEELVKMKALAKETLDNFNGVAAVSFGVDANSRPPFVMKYVFEVKDADKVNNLFDEGVKMANGPGMKQFYGKMGIASTFTLKRATAGYKGVSINSARLDMKITDPNAGNASMINAMYGGGFDYQWAVANGLCVMTAGGDVNSTIRQLIDTVKGGGPKQMSSETKAALALLGQGDKADFFVTYNFVRLLKMVPAMMGAKISVPEIATSSNMAIAGNVGGGKLVIDIAIPKQHISEIMAAFQMMQQQMMMPQKQQGAMPGKTTN